MKIIVCIKQVPAGSAEVDPETGTLKRSGFDNKTNPYDLFAIEAALRLRDKVGGTVTALTMGPPHAEPMMRDAFMMGVDETVILSDRAFAGSDVLATSYTLAQGIRLLEADIVICGRQTTDGDTAQIGPAVAEHLGIPHAAWVSSTGKVTETSIVVCQELASVSQISKIPIPCLITVEKNIYMPRLPSYRRKLTTADKAVRILSFADLRDGNINRYGLKGSATTVERMFPPDSKETQVYLDGDSVEKADKLFDALTALKCI